MWRRLGARTLSLLAFAGLCFNFSLQAAWNWGKLRHGLFFLASSFFFAFCASRRSTICANARAMGLCFVLVSGVAGVASSTGGALFASPASVRLVGRSFSAVDRRPV